MDDEYTEYNPEYIPDEDDEDEYDEEDELYWSVKVLSEHGKESIGYQETLQCTILKNGLVNQLMA